MLRALVRNRLNAAERKLGASLEYLRHVVDVSPGAFFKFAKLLPVAAYRRVLPPAPWHVAQIVAAHHEDCGPCVQMALDAARDGGLDRALRQAALDGDLAALPDELADVVRFTTGVVTRGGEADRLRERMRALYGEAGLVELSLAIAVTRVFPTFKRGLGYAEACALTPPRA